MSVSAPLLDRARARWLPLLVIPLAMQMVAGCGRLRERPAPRTTPRAKLALVRVDDEADPLARERPPPLAETRIVLTQEARASSAKTRRSTTFAQIELPLGPSQKDATERVTTWLGSIEKPAGTRFALGEHLPSRDDDEAPPTTVHRRTYLLTGEPAITTADIVDAKVERQSDTSQPEILVKLSPDGAKRFGDLTRAWQGQRIAIVLDDLVTSAPLVMSPIEGGQLSITMGRGPSADAEATKLANALRP